MHPKWLPAPPVVIQKFNSDPMEYWLFVRQFKAHILGRLKIMTYFHVSNQSPVIAFQKTWDIFYDEYGHPYKIARCCKEQIKSVQKFSMITKITLNYCVNFLKKCCVSLKNFKQVLSLELMHVIMGIANNLSINLKQAWVEYAV